MDIKVQAGEEVVVFSDWASKPTLQVVKKISPTGQITLENGRRYLKHGCQIGGGSYPFGSRTYLAEATPKLRLEIQRNLVEETITRRLNAIQGDLAKQDLPMLLDLLERLK